MRTIPILLLAFLLSAGCRKMKQDIAGQNNNTPVAGSFIRYTIRQGQQFCDQSTYRPLEISEMNFIARFDSSCIYHSVAAENQYDINKLYGFADNASDHHQYSARIGWRWSNDSLRLFGYVYNAGVVSSEEISPVVIGSDISCSIRINGSQYVFSVNGKILNLPRLSTTEKAKGYQLYPYFGGNEAAPHEISIWIR